MKIAIAGPSGTGKTTLCRFISEAYGLAYIPNSAQIIISKEEKQDMFMKWGYDNKGHKDVINRSYRYPEFSYHFQKTLLKRRAKIIEDNNNFIIDRSPMDNIVYFLSQASSNQDQKICKDFIEGSLEAINKLTHLIILTQAEDQPFVEDNGSRIPNLFYQRYISDIFIGVLNRYHMKIKVSMEVLTSWDFSYRTRKVRKFLDVCQG